MSPFDGIYKPVKDCSINYMCNFMNYCFSCLFNCSGISNIYVGEFTQQTLTLQVNQKKQEPKQEVIFILDRSPSMVAPQDVNANPVRPYDSDGNIYREVDPNGIDWEMTWNKTRWAGILKAADIFCDTYFEGSSGNRILTIYTYYGSSADNISIEKLRRKKLYRCSYSKSIIC